MAVMVDRSGRVPCASQLRDPTKDRRLSRRFGVSLVVMGSGIESTGNPDRYGVLGWCDASESPASATSCSAKACCERWSWSWGLFCSSLYCFQVNLWPKKCVTWPIKSTLVAALSFVSNAVSTSGEVEK